MSEPEIISFFHEPIYQVFLMVIGTGLFMKIALKKHDEFHLVNELTSYALMGILIVCGLFSSVFMFSGAVEVLEYSNPLFFMMILAIVCIWTSIKLIQKGIEENGWSLSKASEDNVV